MKIKICGITNFEDAMACVDAGADLLGFNFCPGSPRYLSPALAREIVSDLAGSILSVGVFVDHAQPHDVARIADFVGLNAIQLHGDESPEYCRALRDRYVIKAFRLDKTFRPETARHYETDAILLDSFNIMNNGGTGKTFDWSLARFAKDLSPNLFLAGGLGPHNVSEAMKAVKPDAVDACSKLEISPGRKDRALVKTFIETVRKYEPS